MFHVIKYREGINHILMGMNVNPMKVLVQLRGRFIVLVDGSNTENRFLIIFNLILLLLFFCGTFNSWVCCVVVY
jgi:hypothetical protein